SDSWPTVQASQVPSQIPGLISTGWPGRNPSAPGPTESTSPAPSEPRTWGRSMGTPGIAASVNRSRWLKAAARIRTRTSPGPATGSGTSTNVRRSRPPCSANPNPRMAPLLAGGFPAGARAIVLEHHSRRPKLIADPVGFREIPPGPRPGPCADRDLDRAGERSRRRRRGTRKQTEDLVAPAIGSIELAERVPRESVERPEILRDRLAPAEEEGDRLPGVEILGQRFIEGLDQVLRGLAPLVGELRPRMVLPVAGEQFGD